MWRVLIALLLCVGSLGCLTPSPRYPFLGIDANWHRYDDPTEKEPLADLSRYCREAHFSTVRLNVSWDNPDHLEGAIAWAKTTGAVEIIADVWPDATVAAGDPWYAGWYTDPHQWLSAWGLWATQITARHPDVIWMFGNEPNRDTGPGGRPLLWAAIYEVFREGAKPGTRIIGPALGHSVPEKDAMVWFREWLAQGARPDIIGVHPYDKGKEVIEGVRSVLNEVGMGGLEIWAVETSGSPRVGPRTHVARLQKWGYSRVVYHVLGGWRPEDRPTRPSTIPLILTNRIEGQIVISPTAKALQDLGKKLASVP